MTSRSLLREIFQFASIGVKLPYYMIKEPRFAASCAAIAVPGAVVGAGVAALTTGTSLTSLFSGVAIGAVGSVLLVQGAAVTFIGMGNRPPKR